MYEKGVLRRTLGFTRQEIMESWENWIMSSKYMVWP
jgi:hypothetical protein